MKKYLIVITTLVFTIACRKAITGTNPDSLINGSTAASPHSDTTAPPATHVDTPKNQQAAFPSAPSSGCFSQPLYGDTIIFPQPAVNGQDYIVSPVFNPGPGKYLSWPLGMAMDSVTGAIDVTKTESGLRYIIGYVAAGTTDTCISQLIIGGVDYMDSVYVIANGATMALPYFNANPYLPTPCSSPNSCIFDVTGSASNAGVIVNSLTGVIDLQKTLTGTGLIPIGAFGLIPINGSTVTTNIYYRLNDASNNTLQSIPVQLMYYDSYNLLSTGLLGNILISLQNILTNRAISTYANPRPPLIVVVRQ